MVWPNRWLRRSAAALFRTLANSTFASVLCARFPPLHLNLIFLFEKESTAPAATNSAKAGGTGSSHPSFSRVSRFAILFGHASDSAVNSGMLPPSYTEHSRQVSTISFRVIGTLSVARNTSSPLSRPSSCDLSASTTAAAASS